MTRYLALMLFSLAGFLGTVAFTGCDVQEGPVEEAAEGVDEAAEEVADEIDDAVDEE